MPSPAFFAPRRREPPGAVRQCADCGAPLHGAYCSACGQRDDPIRQPIGHLIRETVEDAWSLDGKLWRSVALLLFRPGVLTAAYVDGQRTRYIRPFRLYLIATVGFFFLLSVVDPVGRFVETQAFSGAADTLRDAADNAEIARDALARLGPAVGDEAARADLDRARDRAEALRQAWVLDRLRASGVAVDSLPNGVAADSEMRGLDSLARESIELGFLERMPSWLKGPTLRRLEGAHTESDRRTAVQALGRELLGQVPTAMFVLLPVYAFLLKLLYLRGGSVKSRRMGRRRRLRRARKGWRRSARAIWATLPMRARAWRRARLRYTLRARRPRFLSEHLVFALHVHAFAFAVFAGLVMLAGFGQGRLAAFAIQVLTFTVPVYFLLAQKRVYAQGWWKTIGKAGFLAFLYVQVLAGGLVLAAALAAALG